MAKEIKKTILEMFEEVHEYLEDTEAPEEMVEFMVGRIEQTKKASEKAKAARLKKTGGEKKDVAQADFYVDLRNKIYPVLTTEQQTGDELLGQIENITPNGKQYLAAQVAVALKPLVGDGTVVVGKKVAEYKNKAGLVQQTMRTAYKLA